MLQWLLSNYPIPCLILAALMIGKWGISKYLSQYSKISVKQRNPLFLAIPLTALTADPERLWFYVGCIITVLMGNVFRWAYMYHKGELTWKSATVQFFLSMPMCYIGYQMWDHYKWEYPIQGILFVVTIFSVFLAGLIDNAGKISLLSLAERWINNIKAYKKIEE